MLPKSWKLQKKSGTPLLLHVSFMYVPNVCSRIPNACFLTPNVCVRIPLCLWSPLGSFAGTWSTSPLPLGAMARS